jgi:steroid delta-isomerase-like uncharacterized protein
MSGVAIVKGASEGVVFAVLKHLNNGEIDDAIALFAEEFMYKDHGIGLEFTKKERLAEFFRKTRELFPDSRLQVDSILMNLDHMVAVWTLRSTVTQPFYAALSRKVPILLHGVSVVRTKNGKITEWSDYYDGPTSRRIALAAHFTDWDGF